MSADDAGAVRRPAGRVLLVDPAGSVLLLRHLLGPQAAEAVWACPGGGCEPGESSAAAALRELAEETGIGVGRELASHLAPVHSERRTFSWDGVAYDQTDDFFLVRVAERPPIHGRGRTDTEADTLTDHGWFSPAELAGLGERFEPADLIAVLARLGGAQ